MSKNKQIIQERENANSSAQENLTCKQVYRNIKNVSICPSDWQIFQTAAYGMGIWALSYPLTASLNGTEFTEDTLVISVKTKNGDTLRPQIPFSILAKNYRNRMCKAVFSRAAYDGGKKREQPRLSLDLRGERECGIIRGMNTIQLLKGTGKSHLHQFEYILKIYDWVKNAAYSEILVKRDDSFKISTSVLYVSMKGDIKLWRG